LMLMEAERSKEFDWIGLDLDRIRHRLS
jgi:hypothetical protein